MPLADCAVAGVGVSVAVGRGGAALASGVGEDTAGGNVTGGASTTGSEREGAAACAVAASGGDPVAVVVGEDTDGERGATGVLGADSDGVAVAMVAGVAGSVAALLGSDGASTDEHAAALASASPAIAVKRDIRRHVTVSKMWRHRASPHRGSPATGQPAHLYGDHARGLCQVVDVPWGGVEAGTRPSGWVTGRSLV